MTDVIERGNTQLALGSNLSSSIVFLVWAYSSIRAKNLSKHLGSNLYLINFKFKYKFYSPIKYILLFMKTFHILKKEKPEIIICQIPPIFCALSAIVCSYLLNLKSTIVIDVHTMYVGETMKYLPPVIRQIFDIILGKYFIRASRILNKATMRRASIIVVTNVELQNDLFDDYGIRSIILADALPDLVSD